MSSCCVVGAPPDVAFFYFGEDTSTAPALPNDIIDGDVAVLTQRASFAIGTPSAATPAGWTNLGNTTSTDTRGRRYQSWYKELAASDAGVMPSPVMSGSETFCLIIFRGASLAQVSSVLQDTHASSISHTIPAGGVIAPVIAVSCIGRITTVSSAQSSDPAMTFEHAFDQVRDSIGYKIFNLVDTPEDVDVTASSGAQVHMHSFYLRLNF